LKLDKGNPTTSTASVQTDDFYPLAKSQLPHQGPHLTLNDHGSFTSRVEHNVVNTDVLNDLSSSSALRTSNKDDSSLNHDGPGSSPMHSTTVYGNPVTPSDSTCIDPALGSQIADFPGFSSPEPPLGPLESKGRQRRKKKKLVAMSSEDDDSDSEDGHSGSSSEYTFDEDPPPLVIEDDEQEEKSEHTSWNPLTLERTF
jgi:hypothetical protein